jgi:hypothetical protein
MAEEKNLKDSFLGVRAVFTLQSFAPCHKRISILIPNAVTQTHKKTRSNKMNEFFLYNILKTTYLPSAAFFASLFNFRFSQIVPPIQ